MVPGTFCPKWTYFRLGMTSAHRPTSRREINYSFPNPFSCALLELWSEGTAPFEFSQLLAYRAGETEMVKKHMEQLENDNLRDLISSMISLNPAERKSADVYLDEERGRLFPEYFYTFLQSYMQMFSSLQILPPDDKIMRLSSDINQIIDIFAPKPTADEEKSDERPIPDDDGLIIITAVVTSCIRGLKYCMTKLRCLEILQKLSMHTTSETVLDRILPYIVSECRPVDRVHKLIWIFIFRFAVASSKRSSGPSSSMRLGYADLMLVFGQGFATQRREHLSRICASIDCSARY